MEWRCGKGMGLQEGYKGVWEWNGGVGRACGSGSVGQLGSWLGGVTLIFHAVLS